MIFYCQEIYGPVLKHILAKIYLPKVHHFLESHCTYLQLVAPQKLIMCLNWICKTVTNRWSDIGRLGDTTIGAIAAQNVAKEFLWIIENFILVLDSRSRYQCCINWAKINLRSTEKEQFFLNWFNRHISPYWNLRPSLFNSICIELIL